MQLPIDEILTPTSAESLANTMLSALELVGVPARSWRPGGVARSIVGAAASVVSIAANLVASVCGASFTETASGAWLTLHASSVFGIDRRPATHATGEVVLINDGGGDWTFASGDLVLYSSRTNQRYRVIGGGTLPSNGTLTVTVVAVEAGTIGSAETGGIDSLETSWPRVSCSNPQALVGADEQSDEELRLACRNARPAMSTRGPRDIYEHAASVATLADGTPAGITRCTLDLSSVTSGIVSLYVATPSGEATPLQLAAVIEAVERIARPDVAVANVYSAYALPIDCSVTIYVRRGDAAAVQREAVDALRALAASTPIGGYRKQGEFIGALYGDAIADACFQAARKVGATPFDVDISPSHDFALSNDQVPVMNATITVQVAQ